jgi:predicted nuclease of predicted toxin-antitoxin system
LKLLFDQNLSYRLVGLLEDHFPKSEHVKSLGMEEASDSSIWEYARVNDFVIISKDSDFHQRSFLYGHPPKVIWIQRGNCSTIEIYDIVLKHQDDIARFLNNSDSSFLEID